MHWTYFRALLILNAKKEWNPYTRKNFTENVDVSKIYMVHHYATKNLDSTSASAVVLFEYSS